MIREKRRRTKANVGARIARSSDISFILSAIFSTTTHDSAHRTTTRSRRSTFARELRRNFVRTEKKYNKSCHKSFNFELGSKSRPAQD